MNTNTQFKSDIDIDFANRDQILAVLNSTPASIIRDGKISKHNTGVYFTDIPVDPFTGLASVDYESAEDMGYLKLDFLNVNLYQQVKDETHLLALMNTEPDWTKLYDPEFCGQLSHVGNHYTNLLKMAEPVDSIPRLAMFLAIIRPSKRHLIGLPWKEVAKTIWDKPDDGSYGYKKSHGVAYANLVVVHMNLLVEQKRYSV
jgi:hypothetical protein